MLIFFTLRFYERVYGDDLKLMFISDNHIWVSSGQPWYIGCPKAKDLFQYNKPVVECEDYKIQDRDQIAEIAFL